MQRKAVNQQRMKNEMIITVNSLFESVTYHKEANSWKFSFANNINFFVESFWRLLKNKSIAWVSRDIEQAWGYSVPEDIIDKLTSELTGKCLKEIKVKPDSSDLELSLTDNLQIEIFISSIRYESYNFMLDNKNYIGLGSGEFGIETATDNPQIFTTRKL